MENILKIMIEPLSQIDPVFLGTTVAIILSILGLLIYLLILKSEQLKEAQFAFTRIQRSFDELDEQAKLIVKTDLELNRAQEELDRRLNSLNALQKTSRLISTTLDQDEIFKRLESSLITELGFEKNLILLFESNDKLISQINVGFNTTDINVITGLLEKDSTLMKILKESHGLTSASGDLPQREKIKQIFNTTQFILTPILNQTGMIGILFVGNTSENLTTTEGDEELLSILAGQIGQSLDNAQLFEQVYRSRQDLENKVQERTKELAAALEEVKKISKMKSDFISAVSHELRTPLTSVKGYASILISGKMGDLPQSVIERLEKINKHSDNLVKMINDLLDIARLESGRVEMKFIKQLPSALIENVRDLLTPQIKEKSITLKIDASPALPFIMVDSHQIERVLINLLGNAIKFTPPQGTITICAKEDKNFILFSIADTGIGIKEEDIPRLFDEFYRVDNPINQNLKGTGLGLSLAKNIVEAHKGKIWLNSKINEGTVFYFTIPTADAMNG